MGLHVPLLVQVHIPMQFLPNLPLGHTENKLSELKLLSNQYKIVFSLFQNKTMGNGFKEMYCLV